LPPPTGDPTDEPPPPPVAGGPAGGFDEPLEGAVYTRVAVMGGALLSGFVVAWNTTCHVALGCRASLEETSASAAVDPRHRDANGVRSTEKAAVFVSYVAGEDTAQFAAGGFASDPRTGLKDAVTAQASRVARS